VRCKIYVISYSAVIVSDELKKICKASPVSRYYPSFCAGANEEIKDTLQV
jgi:hypothetical protein